MTANALFSKSICTVLASIAAAVVNIGGVALMFGWSNPAGAAPTEAPEALAAAASPCMPPANAVQRHILAVSEDGVEALSRYVRFTRGVHGFDLVETARWVDAYRARQAACAAIAAREQAGRPIAVDMDRP